jgi:hypothetical protein
MDMNYRELMEKICRHCHLLERLHMTPEIEFWMKVCNSIGKAGAGILDQEAETDAYMDRMENERKAMGYAKEVGS